MNPLVIRIVCKCDTNDANGRKTTAIVMGIVSLQAQKQQSNKERNKAAG
jgi:hypothetical protein